MGVVPVTLPKLFKTEMRCWDRSANKFMVRYNSGLNLGWNWAPPAAGDFCRVARWGNWSTMRGISMNSCSFRRSVAFT